MSTLLTKRGDLVTATVEYLRDQIADLALVKPYEGELDRYSKKIQLKDDIFPVEVNLQTPFALIISKERENVGENNQRLKLKHYLSIYVGVSVNYNFGSTDTPTVFELLGDIASSLHNRQMIQNAGPLTLVSDGEYLVKTDLFVVYDQKYYQLELGF